MYTKRINFAVNPVGSLRTDLRVLPLRVEKDSFPHRLVPLESRDNALVVAFFIYFCRWPHCHLSRLRSLPRGIVMPLDYYFYTPGGVGHIE